ncbi:hypothetical protein Tco_0552395, partial [Tanacetum coccineum]
MAYSSVSSNSKGNPSMDLQDQGVIDSGCSRHMTGNMSYLTNYEEVDGGLLGLKVFLMFFGLLLLMFVVSTAQ